MACDICGKKGVNLEDVKPQYKTDDIQQVCDSCIGKLNKQLFKLREINRKLNETWIKSFAINLKVKLFKG